MSSRSEPQTSSPRRIAPSTTSGVDHVLRAGRSEQPADLLGTGQVEALPRDTKPAPGRSADGPLPATPERRPTPTRSAAGPAPGLAASAARRAGHPAQRRSARPRLASPRVHTAGDRVSLALRLVRAHNDDQVIGGGYFLVGEPAVLTLVLLDQDSHTAQPQLMLSGLDHERGQGHPVLTDGLADLLGQVRRHRDRQLLHASHGPDGARPATERASKLWTTPHPVDNCANRRASAAHAVPPRQLA